MTIIMKDQLPRQRKLDDKKDIADVLIKMLVAFAIFCAVTVGFTLLSIIPTVQATSVTNVTYDNLMGPEAVEYMVLHPGTYTEYDIE